MVVESLITESAGEGASAGALWLLSCSSQRVRVKELQLVYLAKYLWLLSFLITESAGEGAAGVFG